VEVLFVLKQEVFRFALPVKRAVNPIFNSTGDHCAPESLFCHLRGFTDISNRFRHFLLPSGWPFFISSAARYKQDTNAVPLDTDGYGILRNARFGKYRILVLFWYRDEISSPLVKR
jgi:hypothetical protein